MTTKIIITPANHGAAKAAAGSHLSGTPRTVRVVTVGAPPNTGARTADVLRTQTKTVMTVPVTQQTAANRGPVRAVFKRVYSGGAAEGAVSLPVMATPPRKRQRLDHLTADQKNQRRKLKNRVAAQTARDRKKLQMDLLESRVASLERQNDELLQQNTFLEKQNELLSQQNALLLERLEPKQPKQEPGSAPADAAPSPVSVESAALISGPQQKDQEAREAGRRRQAAAALLALSLISWAGFNVALATTAARALLTSSSCSARPSSAVRSRRAEGRRPPALLWWGPQQKGWSPALIS